MFDIKSDVDSISDVLSREDIAKTYGNKFTNFVFNDILKSYPSQKWSMENGGSEEKNAGMVYPWFFPKLNRGSIRSTETNSYHDNVRKKGVQCIMYPNDNGFEGFMKGLHESINEKYCEIKVGAKELEYKFKDNGVELDSIVCEGRNITADHFFWCAPPAQLLKMFNKLNIQGKPQKIVLGSFVVENEIQHQYHEILVGSSEHNINRISFPGLIGQRENKQVQVEFYFPNGEYPEDEKYWFEIWQESLLKLKLLEPNNKIIEKDFKIEFRGFVTKDDLQETTERSMDVLGEVGTNIAIPYFNFGPENINRVVPGVINNITRIISEKK